MTMHKLEIPEYYEFKRAIEVLALDRRDWVKREPEWDIFRSYLELISSRLEAVETHLEQGAAAGKAFVRAKERPMVGAEALHEVMKPISLLSERLDRLESQLSQSGKAGAGKG